MSIPHILLLCLLALVSGWLASPRWRIFLLFAGSLLAIYWLQPATPIRNLDFWFPTVSIALTVFVWSTTRSPSQPGRTTWAAALLVIGVVLAVGLTRYMGPLCCLTASRPPELLRIVLVLAGGGLAAAVPAWLVLHRRFLAGAAILGITLLFIILKSEGLAVEGSAWLRRSAGQPADLASALDLRWLGFSYLAFRLLHTLRDFQAGKLPELSLSEFITYALFFPAFVAGPIDRAQHFKGQLDQALQPPLPAEERPGIKLRLFSHPTFVTGGWRVFAGIFKKFAIADTLALFALSPQNAVQVDSPGWMWLLVYAYALRLYFDFSGYTDIAIGMGLLARIRLPENFDRPYLRTNLTAFWNSWHITLAQWFRAYFFNPVTRLLRSQPRRLPIWAVVLVGQLGTMVLIGLWHGITWNFAAWGAWHALGLFAHNRWSDWSRLRLAGLESRPRAKQMLSIAGWFLTFHYVSLGWVWFALPDIELSRRVFSMLFGG